MVGAAVDKVSRILLCICRETQARKRKPDRTEYHNHKLYVTWSSEPYGWNTIAYC